MSYELVSVDTMPMSTKHADWMQGLRSVPGERVLSKSRLRFLRKELAAGRLISFRWAVCELGGVKYRINGQHTSYLFCNIPVKPGKARHVPRKPMGDIILEEYTADSIESVIELWSCYDAAYSSRTQGEILRTELQANKLEVPQKIASTVSSALSLKYFGDRWGSRVQATHYERARLVSRHDDFLYWCAGVFSPPGKCLKSGVILAAFISYEEDEQAAKQFWAEVQDGSNGNPHSGSRALQRMLLEYSAKGRSGRKKFNNREWAELALSAWYSWVDGSDVKVLRLSPTRGLSRFVELGKGLDE